MPDPIMMPIPVKGPEIPDRTEPREWPKFQAGNADGVLWLGEIASATLAEDGSVVKEILVPSLNSRAIPYLRPVSQVWKDQNPKMKGWATPMYMQGMLPPEALQAGLESRRGVEFLVLADCPGALCPQATEHRRRWRFVQAEEGVWCVYYV